MNLTTRRIALLSLMALAACGSPSPTTLPPQAVAAQQVQGPAPAAWAMVPVAQPSYHQRLEALFSASSTTQTTTRALKPNTSSSTSASSSVKD
jgi:predicted small lipoprotein YifL